MIRYFIISALLFVVGMQGQEIIDLKKEPSCQWAKAAVDHINSMNEVKRKK